MPPQLEAFLILAFMVWMVGSGTAVRVKNAVFG